MSKYELELRLRFIFAKCRNIIYYLNIDDRPRVTYIHMVRELRKNAYSLLEEVNNYKNEYDKERKFLKGLIENINPKIKTEECFDTMMNIKEKFNLYLYE